MAPSSACLARAFYEGRLFKTLNILGRDGSSQDLPGCPFLCLHFMWLSIIPQRWVFPLTHLTLSELQCVLKH